MITVKLMGGLGNQMFQYALARTLADKHQTRLGIDASLCADAEKLSDSGLSLRPFGLDVFQIRAELVDTNAQQKMLDVRKEHRFKRQAAVAFCGMARRFSGQWSVRICERRDIKFDQSLLRLPDHTALAGYFPSHKYFAEVEAMIRRDLSFKLAPDAQNQEMIETISSTNSVALHVRRGDYVSNAKTSAKFGVCSLSYYQQAMERMAQTLTDPVFFVFTNDPAYVKANLVGDYRLIYVLHNTGEKSYEDMRLMSLCQHNIIANSSFGWWGAWLNPNREKRVIAPSPVFEGNLLPDADFYPASWTLLPKGPSTV